MPDEDALRNIARTRCGIVSRSEAMVAGFTHRSIGTRISRGSWYRVGQAIVIRDLHQPGDRATAWMLHAHYGPASIISGPLALRLQRWDAPGSDHIVLNQSDTRSTIDLDVRVVRRTSPRFRVLPHVPPLAPRLDALADTLVRRTERGASELLDLALQQRWIQADDITAMIEARSGSGRKGQPRLRRLQVRASTGSRSEAEQLMGRLLRRTGGNWIANYAVHDEQGRTIAEIDFADLALKVAIEVDGRAFHSDQRSFERDRERQNMLVLRGWVILRFTWERLINDPEAVIAEVVAALTAAQGA